MTAKAVEEKSVRAIKGPKGEGYTTYLSGCDRKEFRHELLNTRGREIQNHIEEDGELQVLLATAVGLGIGRVVLTAEESIDVPGMVDWFVALLDGKPKTKEEVLREMEGGK